MGENGTVIRLGMAQAEAVVAKYARLLSEDVAADDAGRSGIPAGDLPLLRRALQARLRPAARVDVATAVMLLAGSFKLGSQVEDPEIFVSGMIEELSDYPADILEAAISSARRTKRCLPSIAEMVEICESLVAERRTQLRVLERIETQHGQEGGEA